MPAQTNKYNLGMTEVLFDLEVPSGAMCQVRRPGPMGLIKAGVLDRLDILGSIVQTDHVDRVAGRPAQQPSSQDVLELLKNKEQLTAVDEMIQRAVAYVVTQPKLHLDPKLLPEDDPDKDQPRVSERIYVDSVDFVDQIYIFQFVLGGTADLATFRAQWSETLGGVESIADLANQAQ